LTIDEIKENKPQMKDLIEKVASLIWPKTYLNNEFLISQTFHYTWKYDDLDL
jgi:hypothetical protein